MQVDYVVRLKNCFTSDDHEPARHFFYGVDSLVCPRIMLKIIPAYRLKEEYLVCEPTRHGLRLRIDQPTKPRTKARVHQILIAHNECGVH
jgi:hypothetical protein